MNRRSLFKGFFGAAAVAALPTNLRASMPSPEDLPVIPGSLSSRTSVQNSPLLDLLETQSGCNKLAYAVIPSLKWRMRTSSITYRASSSILGEEAASSYKWLPVYQDCQHVSVPFTGRTDVIHRAVNLLVAEIRANEDRYFLASAPNDTSVKPQKGHKFYSPLGYKAVRNNLDLNRNAVRQSLKYGVMGWNAGVQINMNRLVPEGKYLHVGDGASVMRGSSLGVAILRDEDQGVWKFSATYSSEIGFHKDGGVVLAPLS